MLSNFKNLFTENKEIYLRVKVHPHTAQTQVRAVLEDETIKIDIAAAPEKGKANDELIGFLSQEFDVSKRQIVIISGIVDRVKLIKISK